MSWDTRDGQVLNALAAKLRAMTIAGGYHYDVKPTSVVTELVNILTVPETELPFFMVEPTPGGMRDWHPANELEVIFPVLITARVMANGTASDRKFQAGLNLLGDLERALTQDITLGGLLFDLRVQPAEPLVGLGNDNQVLVMPEVLCHYHRTYGVP